MECDIVICPDPSVVANVLIDLTISAKSLDVTSSELFIVNIFSLLKALSFATD